MNADVHRLNRALDTDLRHEREVSALLERELDAAKQQLQASGAEITAKSDIITVKEKMLADQVLKLTLSCMADRDAVAQF